MAKRRERRGVVEQAIDRRNIVSHSQPTSQRGCHAAARQPRVSTEAPRMRKLVLLHRLEAWWYRLLAEVAGFSVPVSLTPGSTGDLSEAVPACQSCVDRWTPGRRVNSNGRSAPASHDPGSIYIWMISNGVSSEKMTVH